MFGLTLVHKGAEICLGTRAVHDSDWDKLRLATLRLDIVHMRLDIVHIRCAEIKVSIC